jgi:hypothetical protein
MERKEEDGRRVNGFPAAGPAPLLGAAPPGRGKTEPEKGERLSSQIGFLEHRETRADHVAA